MKFEPHIHRVAHDSPLLQEELKTLYSQGFRIVASGIVNTGFDPSEILLLFMERKIPESLTDETAEQLAEVWREMDKVFVQ